MAIFTVIRLPDNSLISIAQIGRVALFEKGVGILNHRDKMVAWLETSTLPDDEQHDAQTQISSILEEVINNPRRAKQPDWSFLNPTKMTTAPQPVRKIDQPAPEQKRSA